MFFRGSSKTRQAPQGPLFGVQVKGLGHQGSRERAGPPEAGQTGRGAGRRQSEPTAAAGDRQACEKGPTQEPLPNADKEVRLNSSGIHRFARRSAAL